jgi:hypothetical protein
LSALIVENILKEVKQKFNAISGKLYSCRPNHTADMETKAIVVYVSLNVRGEKNILIKVTF